MDFPNWRSSRGRGKKLSDTEAHMVVMFKFPGRVAHGSASNMHKTCRMVVCVTSMKDGMVYGTVPEWRPGVEIGIPVTKFPESIVSELEVLPKRFTAYVTHRAREANEMECFDLRLAENQIPPKRT